MKIYRRQVPYVDDVAALIPYLDARDSGYDPSTLMLLESADIETRQGLTSIAILRASVRATCERQSVTLEPLTATGRIIAEDVLAGLSGLCRVEGNQAIFEVSHDVDERARLLAPSTVEPLRRLLALDFGDAQPWVGGTFAYDYVATFEDLPGVAESANTCPDYQFVLGSASLPWCNAGGGRGRPERRCESESRHQRRGIPGDRGAGEGGDRPRGHLPGGAGANVHAGVPGSGGGVRQAEGVERESVHVLPARGGARWEAVRAVWGVAGVEPKV